ncbi:hypothetical protein GIB67_010827 [Kingdonia uniflora]|uniref:Cyclin N-terminal domain-containing protein n=1 Tax=Kingdonia uniflora TaxID=39325 RepID=A0A7J7L8Y2_9MAGN|nr:hypothetical protein GIB67_010827 [Kingdonia uniflora]
MNALGYDGNDLFPTDDAKCNGLISRKRGKHTPLLQLNLLERRKENPIVADPSDLLKQGKMRTRQALRMKLVDEDKDKVNKPSIFGRGQGVSTRSWHRTRIVGESNEEENEEGEEGEGRGDEDIVEPLGDERDEGEEDESERSGDTEDDTIIVGPVSPQEKVRLDRFMAEHRGIVFTPSQTYHCVAVMSFYRLKQGMKLWGDPNEVHSFYSFQPSTVYLSVNYMDRFLSARCLPVRNQWVAITTTICCLLVIGCKDGGTPCSISFGYTVFNYTLNNISQAESVKFIFQPRTVCRMEILVLTTLNWKLRSITSFHFIGFLASKVDSIGRFVGYLVTRATQIMLDIVRETKFLEYWPSSVAAAVKYYGAKEIPSLSYINFGNVVSWCDGLNQVKLLDQIVGVTSYCRGLWLTFMRRSPQKSCHK